MVSCGAALSFKEVTIGDIQKTIPGGGKSRGSGLLQGTISGFRDTDRSRM